MDDTDLKRTQGFFKRRLRRLFSAKQFYECLQPLFFITFWHGLTPFFITSDGQGSKKLQHSFFGYLNTVLHIFAYSICYTLTLFNGCESVAGYFFNSRITYFGGFMQILSGFIGVTVIYLSAIIPKQRLEHSLRTLHLMDTQLHSVGIKILYSRVLRFSYFILCFMLAINVTFAVGTFKLLKIAGVEPEPSTALYITFVVQQTVVSIAISMFCCVTKMLEKRFAMMHQV